MATIRPPFRPPESNEGPRPVGKALEGYLRENGLAEVSRLAELDAIWPEVVGEDVARHASPRLVRGDVLVVEVDHSAWAAELRFLAGEILRRIEETLGRPVAGTVNVRVRADQRVE
jgi:predicted nucleic acid-binding Zn ribbon protein